ncbi:MAG: NADPH-dependent FMN reductase [Balneolaceae bacterium]
MNVLGISGSLSRHSKTELAVQVVLDTITTIAPYASVNRISLSEADIAFCDGSHPDLYDGDTRRAIDAIAGADLLIAGSPIYRGSYSGAFKNLFDLIPNDALRGKTVGIVATGGSHHHYLAIDHLFRPLFSYFRAYVVPGGVYVSNSAYSDGSITDEGIRSRLQNLGLEAVCMAESLQATYQGPDLPSIKRESLVNPQNQSK